MTDKKPWVIAVLGLTLLCCDNEGSYIGAAFQSEQDVSIAFTDTISISSSTVLLDSIPASGTGTVLIGSYHDDIFGKVESTAYVQMFNESSWNLDEDALFDSAVLLLPYSGYWYGDTTTNTNIEVYQVMEDFVPRSLPLYWRDEGTYSYFNSGTDLYTTSALYFEEDLKLSSLSYKPRPNTKDTLRARIPNARGKEWFSEALKSSNYFASTSQFQNYFKGIAIKAVSGSSVVGIKAQDVKIRIYYREHRSEVLVNTFFDITYTSSYWHYNKFSGDRSNTQLENLDQTNNMISSDLTNNQSYVQSGIGIMTKIEFPHIKDLLNIDESMIINSAALVIEPVSNTFSEKLSLPSTLALFQTNEYNKPLAPLYNDYSDAIQTATISYDPEFGKTSGYTFYITGYIQTLIDQTSTQPNTYALLLGTPLTDLRNSVSRACLGGGNHEDYRMRLEVYFTYKK